MIVSRALIVAEPWITKILDGSKTWEMRATAVSHRGWFGLIPKGSGAVHGVAQLVDTGRPLSPDEMVATFEHHRIPEAMIRSGEVARWNTPWILADVKRLSAPVPYRHPNGAVTWVKLDDDVSSAISDQSSEPHEASHDASADQSSADLKFATPGPRPSSPDMAQSLRSDPAPTNITLIGQVEITQGNLDNNHIYLRSFFDRFPEDAVGGSNRHEKAAQEVIVDWGGDAPVRTDLDGSKRFFRKRGWIGHFFEVNGAEAGDWVLVEEVGAYSYQVRLRKAGRE